MAKQESLSVRLRIVYDGTPPNVWDGDAQNFGVQDKANVLYPGKTERDGRIVFDVTLDLKPERTAKCALHARHSKQSAPVSRRYS
jgi:hypothetical protein